MSKPDPIIECPCYHVCSFLGVSMGAWCRYRESAVPPPGMHRFHPKDTWCPGGVQANVLMLASMLSGEMPDRERLQRALEQVREWARTLRKTPSDYSLGR